jgi:hypothetical protein
VLDWPKKAGNPEAKAASRASEGVKTDRYGCVKVTVAGGRAVRNPRKLGSRMPHQPSGKMECRECMDLLADYVDGTLPKDQAELLDWHLEGCPNCVAFVNTYKGTVDAARRLRETKIPTELQQKLVAFLKRSARA